GTGFLHRRGYPALAPAPPGGFGAVRRGPAAGRPAGVGRGSLVLRGPQPVRPSLPSALAQHCLVVLPERGRGPPDRGTDAVDGPRSGDEGHVHVWWRLEDA